eukprot:jgi/Botrbrau1/22403/Bobra.0091s0010.4
MKRGAPPTPVAAEGCLSCESPAASSAAACNTFPHKPSMKRRALQNPSSPDENCSTANLALSGSVCHPGLAVMDSQANRVNLSSPRLTNAACHSQSTRDTMLVGQRGPARSPLVEICLDATAESREGSLSYPSQHAPGILQPLINNNLAGPDAPTPVSAFMAQNYGRPDPNHASQASAVTVPTEDCNPLGEAMEEVGSRRGHYNLGREAATGFPEPGAHTDANPQLGLLHPVGILRNPFRGPDEHVLSTNGQTSLKSPTKGTKRRADGSKLGLRDDRDSHANSPKRASLRLNQLAPPSPFLVSGTSLADPIQPSRLHQESSFPSAMAQDECGHMPPSSSLNIASTPHPDGALGRSLQSSNTSSILNPPCISDQDGTGFNQTRSASPRPDTHPSPLVAARGSPPGEICNLNGAILPLQAGGRADHVQTPSSVRVEAQGAVQATPWTSYTREAAVGLQHFGSEDLAQLQAHLEAMLGSVPWQTPAPPTPHPVAALLFRTPRHAFGPRPNPVSSALRPTRLGPLFAEETSLQQVQKPTDGTAVPPCSMAAAQHAGDQTACGGPAGPGLPPHFPAHEAHVRDHLSATSFLPEGSDGAEVAQEGAHVAPVVSLHGSIPREPPANTDMGPLMFPASPVPDNSSHSGESRKDAKSRDTVERGVITSSRAGLSPARLHRRRTSSSKSPSSPQHLEARLRVGRPLLKTPGEMESKSDGCEEGTPVDRTRKLTVRFADTPFRSLVDEIDAHLAAAAALRTPRPQALAPFSVEVGHGSIEDSHGRRESPIQGSSSSFSVHTPHGEDSPLGARGGSAPAGDGHAGVTADAPCGEAQEGDLAGEGPMRAEDQSPSLPGTESMVDPSSNVDINVEAQAADLQTSPRGANISAKGLFCKLFVTHEAGSGHVKEEEDRMHIDSATFPPEDREASRDAPDSATSAVSNQGKEGIWGSGAVLAETARVGASDICKPAHRLLLHPGVESLGDQERLPLADLLKASPPAQAHRVALFVEPEQLADIVAFQGALEEVEALRQAEQELEAIQAALAGLSLQRLSSGVRAGLWGPVAAFGSETACSSTGQLHGSCAAPPGDSTSAEAGALWTLVPLHGVPHASDHTPGAGPELSRPLSASSSGISRPPSNGGPSPRLSAALSAAPHQADIPERPQAAACPVASSPAPTSLETSWSPAEACVPVVSMPVVKPAPVGVAQPVPSMSADKSPCASPGAGLPGGSGGAHGGQSIGHPLVSTMAPHRAPSGDRGDSPRGAAGGSSSETCPSSMSGRITEGRQACRPNDAEGQQRPPFNLPREEAGRGFGAACDGGLQQEVVHLRQEIKEKKVQLEVAQRDCLKMSMKLQQREAELAAALAALRNVRSRLQVLQFPAIRWDASLHPSPASSDLSRKDGERHSAASFVTPMTCAPSTGPLSSGSSGSLTSG